MKTPIRELIIEAGREAFESCYGSRAGDKTGRNVIERFRNNLGIRRPTLHDWLKFFFGLTWPDWKRVYVCRTRSCSIVDVANTGSSKYYPIEKLRKRGVCSCSIKGDTLILIDRRPDELTQSKLTNLFRRELGWFKGMEVISGSHLPLLEKQEDR